MPCGVQDIRTGSPTAESSVLQTVTTTTTLMQTAQITADGGSESAVRVKSAVIVLATGRHRTRPKTCGPVACW